MSEQQSLQLDRTTTGTRAVVDRLLGSRNFASRLAAMGLSVGAEIEVLQNRGKGPILILVRDTRIALGRREAMRILVEQVHSEQPKHKE